MEGCLRFQYYRRPLLCRPCQRRAESSSRCTKPQRTMIRTCSQQKSAQRSQSHRKLESCSCQSWSATPCIACRAEETWAPASSPAASGRGMARGLAPPSGRGLEPPRAARRAHEAPVPEARPAWRASFFPCQLCQLLSGARRSTPRRFSPSVRRLHCDARLPCLSWSCSMTVGAWRGLNPKPPRWSSFFDLLTFFKPFFAFCGAASVHGPQCLGGF